ncbi:MAG: restriction endonuclease subunit S, partial [Crocinitomicaceae bacterium]|nr:restriction endonuclease subunit S [Crocinitomicaceae bacterium]
MKKLNKNNWKEVSYGDYVDHVEETERNPDLRKSAKYVSVDNIESNNLKIQSFAKEEMPTFFRKFKRGQVLFSKRNLYLNKVVVADFDGICSPHIWALEAKKGLMQELLPFYMLTKTFFEYTNSNAAGTMSKYLGWEEMSAFKINLPPPAEQKQIAALFQSIETAMEQVDGQEKNLKALQKSLVNGLLSKEPVFGNLLNTKNCTATTFGEIAECDKKYPEHEKEVERFVGLEFIEADNFQLQGWGEIANGTTFSKRFATGDVLFGKRRAYLKKVAVADFDGICSGDILVIRAKAKKMLQGLLPYYIS